MDFFIYIHFKHSFQQITKKYAYTVQKCVSKSELLKNLEKGGVLELKNRKLTRTYLAYSFQQSGYSFKLKPLLFPTRSLCLLGVPPCYFVKHLDNVGILCMYKLLASTRRLLAVVVVLLFCCIGCVSFNSIYERQQDKCLMITFLLATMER